jgi:signal peptidase I
MTPVRPILRTFFRPLIIAGLIAVTARMLVVQVFAIPSGSMMPTLQAGDQILVTPYQLPWTQPSPKRGDVVVFRRFDATQSYFVKRVIGVPGDHLEIRSGQVYVDGRAIREPYILAPGGGNIQPEIIPADSYFVMGDHRDDSIDSRVWGLVPRSAMVGRARVVFWSAAGDPSYLNAASAANRNVRSHGERIRWDRVLTPIR